MRSKVEKLLSGDVQFRHVASRKAMNTIEYTPKQFKELLDKVNDLLEENDKLKKDVAFWKNESDVHFEELCKGGEMKDALIITREALEECKAHYLKVAEEYEGLPHMWGLYKGKAEVLIDLLKHFDED